MPEGLAARAVVIEVVALAQAKVEGVQAVEAAMSKVAVEGILVTEDEAQDDLLREAAEVGGSREAEAGATKAHQLAARLSQAQQPTLLPLSQCILPSTMQSSWQQCCRRYLQTCRHWQIALVPPDRALVGLAEQSQSKPTTFL